MEWNLADLFEAVADAVPEREALVCGAVRLSYAALDERATRLANALADRGVGPGDHVGLWLYNGNEYLEGMLAAFKLRAVPINVNYRYVADELRYLFVDADLKAVVYEPDFAPLLDEIRADTPLLKSSISRGDDYESALAVASPKREFPPRSADDVYILYTGGTTGMPKGVMWRAEDIFFGALESLVGAGTMSSPEDIGPRAVGGRTRCLPACPFMHGTAHWAALATLFGGGLVVVSPDRRLDPTSLWQLVVDEEVNFLVIVGDAFARPLVDALEADASRFDLSPLKILLSGGAILSPVVKEALVRLLPGVLVIDGIGASETGGQGNMIGAGTGEGPPRFLMNEDTSVLDDELRPVLPGSGTIGRLARRGRVPLGYYKDPEKSAATFPVIDGVRWSVPGDMAMVEEDGSVLLLGRGSVSINTGGEKVFPEEVEAALKAQPAIFDAVVVGVPDERWGQRVTAVVQLREGTTVELDAVAEHARTLIAGYKVPRALVVVDAIVRSPSGKPDYRWAKNVALEAVTLETKETD